MAEIANIALNDSVPASRTFEPSGKDGYLAFWQEETPASASLYPKLSVSMRAPRANQPRKVTVKVTVPQEVTVNSVTTIEAASAFMDFVISENVSATTIADLLSYASEVIENAIISDTISNGKFPY